MQTDLSTTYFTTTEFPLWHIFSLCFNGAQWGTCHFLCFVSVFYYLKPSEAIKDFHLFFHRQILILVHVIEMYRFFCENKLKNTNKSKIIQLYTFIIYF